MTEVILTANDRVEWVVNHSRRRVQRSGILRDLQQKRYEVKPGLAKRLRARAARRRKHRAGRHVR